MPSVSKMCQDIKCNLDFHYISTYLSPKVVLTIGNLVLSRKIKIWSESLTHRTLSNPNENTAPSPFFKNFITSNINSNWNYYIFNMIRGAITILIFLLSSRLKFYWINSFYFSKPNFSWPVTLTDIIFMLFWHASFSVIHLYHYI